MSQLYVSPEQVVVVRNGVSALFKPNVPRPLRLSLVEAAIGAGVRPADGSAPQLPNDKPSSIEDIADAIRRIMANGRAADFTTTGQIRMSVLEKAVGHDVSAEDRDAAMAMIEPVQADE